jgi:hypothetical protein
MTEPIQVWVSPSARDLTRTYMMEQLALPRPPKFPTGITAPWSSTVPAVRPAQFFTLEELNSATEYGVFADAQLIQIRGYSADLSWLTKTMRLIKGLWKVMPAWKVMSAQPGVQMFPEFEVQNVEHAGGPLYDEDPDVPGLRYGQIIAWVSVMTELM